jgi:hypothetical protein
MQRIMDVETGVEAYVAGEAHRQVRAEPVCPRCRRGRRLHRHGSYGRHVTDGAGRAVLIAVARFLCLACRRTISFSAAIFTRPRPFCGKAACTRALRDRDDLLEAHVVLPAVTKIVEVLQTVTLRMKQVTKPILALVVLPIPVGPVSPQVGGVCLVRILPNAEGMQVAVRPAKGMLQHRVQERELDVGRHQESPPDRWTDI